MKMEGLPRFGCYHLGLRILPPIFVAHTRNIQPSVVVRPNPVLYQIPKSVQEESKENPSALPYRSVFAVLTLDSVLIYDTHHDQPLAVARGLHYAGLTDCCWSQDGLHLMVCSTDGYISILSFQEGELGQVYKPPPPVVVTTAPLISDSMGNSRNSKDNIIITTNATTTVRAPAVRSPIVTPEQLPQIPPCEAGQAAVLEAPPTKRAKTRVTPTLVSNLVVLDSPPTLIQTENRLTPAKRNLLATETEHVGDAVNRLTLGSTLSEEPTSTCVSSTDSDPVKKKKRIQPILVST